MAIKNSVAAITLTSIDSSTFTGAYQPINVTGLEKPCFMIRILNDSNRDITVSYDGTTDNDFVLAASDVQYLFQTNAQPNTSIANLAKGTIVYVKGTAGGTGSVYLAGYYQPTL